MTKPFTATDAPDGLIVYLSGQMSGLPNYGYDRFNEAARWLRKRGHTVINPAETAGGVVHMSRDWYFRVDFAMIQNCDCVVALPGWRNSKGAKAEIIYAEEIGLPVYLYDPDIGAIGKQLIVEDWTVNAHLEGEHG